MIKSKLFISPDRTRAGQLLILTTFTVNNHTTTSLTVSQHYQPRFHLDTTYNYYIKTYIYERAWGGDHRLNKILLNTTTTQCQKRKISLFTNPFIHENKAPSTHPISPNKLTPVTHSKPETTHQHKTYGMLCFSQSVHYRPKGNTPQMPALENSTTGQQAWWNFQVAKLHRTKIRCSSSFLFSINSTLTSLTGKALKNLLWNNNQEEYSDCVGQGKTFEIFRDEVR